MKKKTAYIILAGGCFWGMEDLFSNLKGVVETSVGYCGGELKNPTYLHVKTGLTGHAEAIKVYYNPQETSLKEILHFFFKVHDPTTLNRQGNDRGSQYRSAIFIQSHEQEKIVKEVINEVRELKRFPNPILTKIEPEGKFYMAEDYHQGYLKKNPGGYTCHFIRD